MEEQFDIRKEYDALHRRYPVSDGRPMIGITTNYSEGNACLAEAYYASIIAAGGVPLLIPPYASREALVETLKVVDAVLLTGGADIDPRYVGDEPDYTLLHSTNPKRDNQELLLTLLAVDRCLPILGICRGIQTLAMALGGNVHQDIYAALGDGLLNHDQGDVERGVATHSVDFVPGSRLGAIFGCETLQVNTFHHQAVSVLPEGFTLSATSPDGVIEGMEAVDGRSIIGVQWHPESFIMKDDNRCMMPLFEWIVGEARMYKRAKLLHEKIISLDSHCDTPMLFGDGYCFTERSKTALVDLHKMGEGALDVTTMVAYLKQGERDAASLAVAVEKANRLLDEIAWQLQGTSYAALASTPQQVYDLKRAGKRVVMRGVENGYAIGDDIKNVEALRRRGVVYITLCHNGDNDICDSARGNGEHGGLSAFGCDVVREMNRVGLMVDLSHASEKSFYDALEVSKTPIVCSHSSCRALCDHPRNLTDAQLRAIAQKGGVAQITMYSGFLVKEGVATIDDFMRHLLHAIEVAGIDHVGIGTDFDGDGAVVGCSDASQLRNLTRELLRHGFGDDDIAKLWGGNWLRVMGVVQDFALV